MLSLNQTNGCLDFISPDPKEPSYNDVCAAFWVSKIITALDESDVSELLHIEVNDHNNERFAFDLPASDIADDRSLLMKLANHRLVAPRPTSTLCPCTFSASTSVARLNGRLSTPILALAGIITKARSTSFTSKTTSTAHHPTSPVKDSASERVTSRRIRTSYVTSYALYLRLHLDLPSAIQLS